MSYWVLTSKEIVFDSAHKIEDYEGKCKELHGHTYTVQAKFILSDLDKRNIAVDFSEINQKLKYITEKVDHKVLNEVFNEKNITAEFISKWIFEEMRQRFPNIYSITVQEGKGGKAEYVGKGKF